MKLKPLSTALLAGAFMAFAMPQALADEAATETETVTYSTSETDFGTLLDTPETRTILETHIAPELFENPQIDMARGMTLDQLQVFSPDVLSDDVLAAINEDLAALS
ncbi:hypothetical protein [Henriciella litoralis]|uniref:hypothetical protein n=1 Tax=Henriciella litoralis TaxID=568102 RepID=UPI0009FFF584|nr:hypothetical protein [Henriciella litoralis]